MGKLLSNSSCAEVIAAQVEDFQNFNQCIIIANRRDNFLALKLSQVIAEKVKLLQLLGLPQKT